MIASSAVTESIQQESLQDDNSDSDSFYQEKGVCHDQSPVTYYTDLIKRQQLQRMTYQSTSDEKTRDTTDCRQRETLNYTPVRDMSPKVLRKNEDSEMMLRFDSVGFLTPNQMD